MNRNFQYSEYAGPTTTAGAWTPISALFTGSVTDTYLYLVTLAINTDGTNVEVDVNSASNYQAIIAPRDTTNDYYSCPAIFAAVGGTSIILDVIPTPALSNVTVRQAGAYAFKLLPNIDVWNDSNASGGTSSSTSYVDVSGTSVTIPATGDYLVFATAATRKSETTANYNIQLAVNGTGYLNQTMRAGTANFDIPWGGMIRLSLAAGDILTVQHKVSTTGSVSTNYPSIVALRVAELMSMSELEDSADSSTTSTSYAAHGNLATGHRTPPFKCLALSSTIYRSQFGSADTSVRSLYDDTVFHESRNETVVATGESTHFGMKALDPAVNGNHQIIQQARHDTGAGSSSMSESATAILGLENNVTVRLFGTSIQGKTNIV